MLVECTRNRLLYGIFDTDLKKTDFLIHDSLIWTLDGFDLQYATELSCYHSLGHNDIDLAFSKVKYKGIEV